LRSTTALLDRFSTTGEPGALGLPTQSGSGGELADLDAGGDADLDAEVEALDDGAATALPKLGSFAVLNRTIDIAQAALARHQMAAYPPDLLIEVPRTACRSLDFHRAAELIDLGHRLAAKALDGLEERGRASS